MFSGVALLVITSTLIKELINLLEINVPSIVPVAYPPAYATAIHILSTPLFNASRAIMNHRNTSQNAIIPALNVLPLTV